MGKLTQLLARSKAVGAETGPTELVNDAKQIVASVRVFGILVLFAFLAALLIWAWRDSRPPLYDETVHLQLAWDYSQWLLHGESFESRWTAIYPPLYHLSLMPGLLLGAPDADRAVLIHVAWLAVLLWGMVNLSKGFIGSPWPGLLATVCFISMPIVLYVERRPLMDFALTAWVVAGMEWLRRTEGLRNRRFVLVFALWSGFGLLLKPFYPMWFVGPVLVSVWQGRKLHGGWRLPVKNLCIGAAVCALVALPYYGWQSVVFFGNALQLASTQGTMEGDPGFQTLAGWYWYVYALKDQCGVLIGLVLLIGTVWTLRRNIRETGVQWLLVWIVCGYVLFTLNHNKDLRYTLPLLPPIAMLGLWQVADWVHRRRAVVIAVGLSLSVFCWNALHIDLPQVKDWQHQALARILKAHRNVTEPFLRMTVVSNYGEFFSRSIDWSLHAEGLPVHSLMSMNQDAQFNEFVVLKSGYLGPGAKAEARDRLLASGRSFDNYYPQIATLPLPDGSVATVYQRYTQHVFAIGDVKETLEERLQRGFAKFIDGPFSVTLSGNPDDWQRGHIDEVRVSGGPWRINGIPVTMGAIHLRDAQFNLYTLWDGLGLGLVGFTELTPCLKFSATELAQYLLVKQKNLKEVAFDMQHGHVLASANVSGWPVAADVALTLDADRHSLLLELQQLSVGQISMPGWLLGRVHRRLIPLDANTSVPGRINLTSIQTDGATLSLGCGLTSQAVARN